MPSNYTLSMLVKLLGRCKRLTQAFTVIDSVSKVPLSNLVEKQQGELLHTHHPSRACYFHLENFQESNCIHPPPPYLAMSYFLGEASGGVYFESPSFIQPPPQESI